MKDLTVITCTYNRGYCLHQLYESLCRQTSDDFLWLVVDDGSTDQTASLVTGWKAEGRIEIEYHYKAHGGLHTALNLAYSLVKTELNTVVDSDDWLTDDAVEKIVPFWKRNRADCFYGIVAENISPDGKLRGTELPPVRNCTTAELYGKYRGRGDKKMILRSDLSALYPYPEFKGETLYPIGYKFLMLDQDYSLLVLRTPVCVVNYGADSMTHTIKEQYRISARGFSHFRNEAIKRSSSPKGIFRNSIHYIAESIYAGDRYLIRHSAKPHWTAMCLPFGLLYYAWLEYIRKRDHHAAEQSNSIITGSVTSEKPTERQTIAGNGEISK